jgi:hypothetical protein
MTTAAFLEAMSDDGVMEAQRNKLQYNPRSSKPDGSSRLHNKLMTGNSSALNFT